MLNWYKLFNMTEWLATELVSRNLSVYLDGVGQKEILITQGNETGVMIDDVFLIVNFNDNNPFQFGDRAVYQDENDDVWVGLTP